MFQRLTLLALIFLSNTLYADVNIVVKSIKYDNGFIEVRIYLDSNTWLQEDQQFEQVIVKASRGEMIVPLKIFRGGIAWSTMMGTVTAS